MTIKEMEGRSGMDRATIRFYEKEGLLTPRRQENGYRDYSEADLELLLRIRLLRSLHISLEEIKALKDGTGELSETLNRQIRSLEAEMKNADCARQICRRMQRDQVTFSGLDAKKYLEDIGRTGESAESTYFEVQEEVLRGCYPWRRYCARLLDWLLYSLVWSLFLWLVLHVDLTAPYLGTEGLTRVADMAAAVILMLLAEPVFLHLFGTTPGKAIFGISVETAEGARLTWTQGLRRTGGILLKGLGFLIPVYSWYRLWKCYKACVGDEEMPWDEGESYVCTVKATQGSRFLIFAAACVLCFFASFAVHWNSFLFKRVPPNKGELTAAQYVENVNYLADVCGLLSDIALQESGEWEREKNEYGIAVDIWSDLYSPLCPEYQIETDSDGHVTRVSFIVEETSKDKFIRSYQEHMFLTVLAFHRIEGPVGFPHDFTGELLQRLRPFELPQMAEADPDLQEKELSLTYSDLTLSCSVEIRGYLVVAEGSGYMAAVPDEKAKEQYFRMEFTAGLPEYR